MKKMIVGVIAVSLVLVGCGSKTTGPTLATKTPWVAAYMAGKPTIFYVSTGKQVQTVGDLIIKLSPNAPDSQGPAGWASPWVTRSSIEVNAIPGVDDSKAVAIKFSKYSPYVKAVAQSKQP